MITRRRLKRYNEGGPLPYGQIGEIAGQFYDNVTPTDQYGVKSDFNAGAGSALKMAGQGAAIGTMIAPGVGTAIGAGVGAIAGAVTGVKQNNKLEALRADQLALNDRQILGRSSARLANYDTRGANNNQIYAKMGGQLPTKYFNGGELTPLSSETMEVNGASHEQGGVQIAPDVEVEGEETINKNYVFSDALGFAAKHKPIARAIGKLEKKVPNNITKNTIDILKRKEEAMKMEQENLKEVLGLKPLM